MRLSKIQVFFLLYVFVACAAHSITSSCHAQECGNLPRVFVSPSQATKVVKATRFRLVDYVETKNSSWIREAAYYSCNGVLGFFLLVTKTGKEYLFQDMPINVWKEFKNADSYGSFYNQSIRGRYRLKTGK